MPCAASLQGLIYRGSYMVNWSPNLQTAVSDLEVEFGEEEVQLFFFKYPIADTDGESVPVATTRPETILGDTAVSCRMPFCAFRAPPLSCMSRTQQRDGPWQGNL